MDETVDYCRQIETYLCRKNGGHLVRIVGPAFETVRDWAVQGVPLKVAFRGIDRCCERANARGGRRRPLRIEFCEADVLDVFDDWRRALGLAGAEAAEKAEGAEGAEKAEDAEGGAGGRAASRKGSLAAHIQRAVTRLLAPTGLVPDAQYDVRVSSLIEELDALAIEAKSARGAGRARIVDRLAVLDREIVEIACTRVDERTAAALRSEADAELSAFIDRMPAESLARARQLAFERFLREALNLPVLSYE